MENKRIGDIIHSQERKKNYKHKKLKRWRKFIFNIKLTTRYNFKHIKHQSDIKKYNYKYITM